ncbi:hypothetical protein BH09SUM1_BH09SUM1_32060 [soil metagenome]
MKQFLRILTVATALLLPTLRVPALIPAPAGTIYDDAGANVFLPSEMSRVDVTIAPADFQYFLDNTDTEEYRTATVRWRNTRIDETLDNVAFTIRGNTSRNSSRKSWKLDFNNLVPGRKFHGLKEANLNGNPNDPSLMRAMLSFEILRRMGLPASRCHLTTFYINGDLWSIQTHVEQIDDQFTDGRFGDQAGNLYKCLNNGTRPDLSFVAAENYTEIGGGQTYRETNNEGDPLRDYSDIADFIRLLNQGTNADILENLDRHVDVDGFLRILAADVAVGSWDDYWYGSNNYYIYHMSEGNRFEWIPFDYDNSLGIDYFSTTWTTKNIDTWGNSGYGTQPAPLVNRTINQQPVWKTQYHRYLLKAAGVLEDTQLQQQARDWQSLIAPYLNGTIEDGGAVGDMPYKSNAVTSPSTWNGSGVSGAHMVGLIPFMTLRAASIRSQVSAAGAPAALPTIRINEVMASNRATIADENGEFDDWIELHNYGASTVDVSGMYLSDDVTSPTKYMIPAGHSIPGGGFLLIWADGTPAQGDLHAPYKLDISGEHVALFHTQPQGRVLIDDMAYSAIGTDQSFGRYPDSNDHTELFHVPTPGAANDNGPGGGGTEPRTPPRLFINEFMASNVSTVANPVGGVFSDWVEVYNDEAVAVDMEDMGLTDDLTNPAKWIFPAGTMIPAKGFLLIWADDAAATGLHASWKLSKGGESLGLYDNEINQRQRIDSFSFGAQADDISQGRLPDGTGAVANLDVPSPGVSNDPNSTPTPSASPTPPPTTPPPTTPPPTTPPPTTPPPTTPPPTTPPPTTPPPTTPPPTTPPPTVTPIPGNTWVTS